MPWFYTGLVYLEWRHKSPRFQQSLKKSKILWYATGEWKWRILPRLWTCLLNLYTTFRMSPTRVSRLLHTDQNCRRTRTSNDNFKHFNIKPSRFLVTLCYGGWNLVPMLRARIKMEISTVQALPPSRKTKTFPSTGKVTDMIFWDSNRILLINYLEKGQANKGTYYAALVHKVKVFITIPFWQYIVKQ